VSVGGEWPKCWKTLRKTDLSFFVLLLGEYTQYGNGVQNSLMYMYNESGSR
jgi:hypothetical protein